MDLFERIGIFRTRGPGVSEVFIISAVYFLSCAIGSMSPFDDIIFIY